MDDVGRIGTAFTVRAWSGERRLVSACRRRRD